MVTLAVDTSGLTASCAVVQDGKVIAELSTKHGKTHSQKILPMIKTTLSMVNKEMKEVDLFAASIGPGSFTGLRIGVVTIKGLAYSLKRPVCGVPTLDALAYSMPDFNGVISPMLDARNNQVFTAFYHKMNGKLEKLSSDSGIPIKEWINKAMEFNKNIMILGDAAEIHLAELKEVFGAGIICPQLAMTYPRASATALLAEEAYHNNKVTGAYELEPFYLRKSQAERLKGIQKK
ncbi:MAG TPA: tRNA (adenosine(37)-N6)-threonylcarbamoyltransferase complex dimerization subunit type 1 TsaB [Clostridiaceae bacterium]|jgi:tRNA threonylcarbamoyladenosine biosynthesis protein TsaB|nr:tRNA (adenosine(37)-N6)-threonylcarbamoyltransferase complex dimerization subunit type 1 TsaB [Clostridiaceae bacterium]